MSRRFLLILLTISAVLLTNFSLIVYFEQQQKAELTRQSEQGIDNQLWQIFQLGSEFQRLREATTAHRFDDLTLRFDIFYSRVKGIEGGSTRDLFPDPQLRSAMTAPLHRFIAEADQLLRQSELSAAQWKTMQALVLQQQDHIDELIQSARLQFANNSEAKKNRLARLGFFRVALSGLQIILLLLFAGLGLSVLWRSEKQRKELVALNFSLSDARQLAEAANATKSRFLAHISHEIRTPLTSILGYTERLRQSLGLSDGQKKQLGHIAHSGQHLLSLLNHVLDLSKSESGKLELITETISLPQLKLELDSMFALMAQEKKLRLEIQLAPDLPEFIMLDGGKLRQILINLIGNSMKFTEQGGVTVHISKQGEAELFELKARVKDTGCGIAEHELAHLFHPFEQTESGKHIGGTGLGLALSRDYARLMGGELVAQSQFGFGCEFTLTVPTKVAAPPQLATRPAPVNYAASALGKTILVVEDQIVNRDLLCEILEEAGALTLAAEDGLAAIKMVAAHPEIERILMDYQMPGLDGLSTTAQLRDLGFNKPIYLISASPEHELRLLPQFKLLDGYLSKPYQAQELLELLGLNVAAAAIDAGDTSIALMDAALAQARLGFSEARFAELALKGFIRLQGLELDFLAALHDADIEAAQRHAHSAKGIASQLGAMALAQQWTLLEVNPQLQNPTLSQLSDLREQSLAALNKKTEL
ncbi:response regulator [Chitinibacter bivalviorum]|uniref:Virulence sensor protein BvgS n=1 Tax=Chitinibacter bivalviorum TaxID=2739434 RepID=A0A7H9BKG4_9NEIS|nr:ATP-binding protein [Chitinibacter bivalviorum]QLG88862.1 response regulator [Chitinibacter bivalviorum]